MNALYIIITFILGAMASALFFRVRISELELLYEEAVEKYEEAVEDIDFLERENKSLVNISHKVANSIEQRFSNHYVRWREREMPVKAKIKIIKDGESIYRYIRNGHCIDSETELEDEFTNP